jgi:hypothetical protein
MRRREFITRLGGATATTWPLDARAQQSERIRHIGVLKGKGSSDRRGLFAAWSCVVLLVCGSAGFLSVSFGIDNYWDLRFYHLYGPWAYLHDRYLYDVGPAQYQGFFNPTADFLFYALTSSPLNEFPRLVAFIMGAVHGLNAVLVCAIALHVLRPLQQLARWTLRAVAVLMGVSGAGFVSLLGTTSNDLINAIFVLAALLCILKAAEGGGRRAAWRGLALAGSWAGIAVGLKFTAAVFMPGLGLIALMAAVRHRTAGGLVAFGVAAMLGFLGAAGHHLLTLWQDFGNPVFPLLNHIFQSPYYEPQPLRDEQFLPRDVWQAIANPFYWAKTNRYLVTELPFREWRGAIAYSAIAATVLALALRRVRKHAPRDGGLAETRGLGLVCIFVIVSYVVWEFGFGNYRYAVVLEMLTGVVTMGAVIRLVTDPRLRIAVALVVMTLAAATTSHLDWGHVPYGDRTIDVRVPPLPKNSVVLVATWHPASYFIPYAEPTAQYLGIENNYLTLSQNNKLASEARRLMQTPGRPKFILSVGEFNADALNALLAKFGLTLSPPPCQPIWSNLAVEALSLCPVVAQ